MFGVLCVIFIAHDTQASLLIETKNNRVYYVLHYQVLLDNSTYEPLFEALRSAEYGDEIDIIIRNNNGGAVVTMLMIKDLIHRCKGRVRIQVQGFAASAAAYLSMQGDVTYLPHNAKLLWHTGSICYGPGLCIRLTPALKNQDKTLYRYYLQAVEFNKYIFNKTLICIRPWSCMYNPFQVSFVDKEYWDFVKTGQDKWISGKKICENIKGWNKLGTDGVMYCMIRGLKK